MTLRGGCKRSAEEVGPNRGCRLRLGTMQSLGFRVQHALLIRILKAAPFAAGPFEAIAFAQSSHLGCPMHPFWYPGRPFWQLGGSLGGHGSSWKETGPESDFYDFVTISGPHSERFMGIKCFMHGIVSMFNFVPICCSWQADGIYTRAKYASNVIVSVRVKFSQRSPIKACVSGVLVWFFIDLPLDLRIARRQGTYA